MGQSVFFPESVSVLADDCLRQLARPLPFSASTHPTDVSLQITINFHRKPSRAVISGLPVYVKAAALRLANGGDGFAYEISHYAHRHSSHQWGILVQLHDLLQYQVCCTG